MSKTRKGRSVAIFIVLFVPFLIGVVVGIILDAKVLSNKKDNKPIENEVVGKVEVNDNDLANDLLKIINNNNLEKVIYNYRSSGVAFDSISNDEKLYLAGIDKYYNSSNNKVTFTSLKTSLINNYNTDFKVKAKDYNFHDIATIKYKDDSYSYEGKSLKYVDNLMFIDLYNVLKLEKENNTYYLTVSGIYHQKLNNADNYSNDRGFVFNEAISNNTSIDELYKTNEEQFMKYTFEFLKESGKYILIKFIKNN